MMNVEDARELLWKLKESRDSIEVERSDLSIHNSDSRFKCREISIAITKLEEAIMWLDKKYVECDAIEEEEGKVGV